MNDDELDRALRAARPHTAADDGWAGSGDGDRALAGILDAASTRPAEVRAFPIRHARSLGLAAGLAAATAAAVAVALLSSGPARQRPSANTPPTAPAPRHGGPVPANMALVSYDSCAGMLAGLRAHTAAHTGAYGLYNDYGPYAYYKGLDSTALRAAVPSAAGSASTAPEHSTTNVQETGVGEPDIVETDGNRVVSVSNGVLRVVDASSHEITGTLDLSMYAGADGAQLLMAGDRVLVLLGEQATPYYRGLVSDYAYPQATGTSSTFLLVDLTGQPRIVSTLHSSGGYVDARMVGDTARLVVQSTPKIVFPQVQGRHSTKQRLARNRNVVQHAPLSAWLPRYQVTAGGTTTSKAVPCASVSHPAHYTGKSMLTVYSVSLAGDLSNPEPISLAADGTSVYASTTSLYVASTLSGRAHGIQTQLDRFDISGSAGPVYLGSGLVPGTLLDSYSMSEYDGSLRVVTTSHGYEARAATSVYALDADTLKAQGHLDGLGRGEQVHAVRFLGPLAYVVTYRSVDPLFVVDLHDPAKPRQAGTLEVTGYSDYLHPVADGRLLGVGEDVNARGVVSGLQVSLFDVDSPAHPKRLDRVVQQHSPSETPIDPHAFLYWPASKLAVIPIDSWNQNQSGAALVVHVGTDDLTALGTIRNPAVSSTDGYDTGIERTLVIGDDIWTMSSSGLQVSDMQTLSRRAWVPFQ